jgi:hypothetical protein
MVIKILCAWFLLAPLCLSQHRITSGELAGFTESPTEHIINRLDNDLTVSKFEGRICFEDGSPLNAVLIELRGPGNVSKIVSTKTNAAGVFHIRNLSEGNYFFKVTLNGYQSLIGHVIISAHAGKSKPIRLTLKVGV